MLPIPEIAERLRSLSHAEFRALMEDTKVPARTLRNLRLGTTTNPRVGTAQPISDWLEKRAA